MGRLFCIRIFRQDGVSLEHVYAGMYDMVGLIMWCGVKHIRLRVGGVGWRSNRLFYCNIVIQITFSVVEKL